MREALCTLGNGYYATRGALELADADGVHYPGTYLAGGYNRLRSEIRGHVVENEDLVNFPNWLPLRFRIEDGDWVRLDRGSLEAYRQELDLHHGVLYRVLRLRDERGRETTLSTRRLVHIRDPHLAAIEWVLRPENWSGRIEVRSALDGRVTNAGVARYRALDGQHLAGHRTRQVDEETVELTVRTNQSGIEVAEAARLRIFADGEPAEAERRIFRDHGQIAQIAALHVRRGSEVRIEKVVALHDSRSQAISEPGLEARSAVARAGGFADLLESHERRWAQLWRRFDVALEGADERWSERASMILRLHMFHLLQTISPHVIERDVGVPARGLHGEAYRGHVFWDELFIFPFLNLRLPEITRALLKYRHRRLPEARAAARAAGYRGAMFPWQSGSNGREETQTLHLNPRSGRWTPDHTRLQRHVGSAIAYNVWQYYQVTGDAEFMAHFGVELLVEIARFWASIATYHPASGRYEIRGVVGPDEYHTAYPGADEPGLANNAYTNVMAVWVLCRALETLAALSPERRRELEEDLGVTERELARWEDISRKMKVAFHDGDIVSQFEGFEKLEELDWEAYRRRYGDIQRLDRILEAEGDTTNRYRCCKQADVLMLFYLFSAEELRELFGRLGYSLEGEAIPRNVEYYTSRTSHGSTLSRVVHAWVLARSDRERSWRLFSEALESDVADIQGGTTAEGVHLGAMAGTVDLVQRGYTGLELRGHVLRLNPALPGELARLRMDVRYRGHSLEIDVRGDAVQVRARECGAECIKIAFGDEEHEIQAGGVYAFRRPR